MNKSVCNTLVALSTVFSSLTVFAQSQVTMYGIVDTGVEYVTHANASGDSVVRIPSLTGTFPSRIGFKGTEDLGGGLQALFVLETGFAVDTGSMGQGNRLFGRQSYVGLKNSYGALMFGRQVNMTYLASLKSDVMGPNIFSISSLDSYLPNARSDNAIGYLGTFSSYTVGATYSFGRDTSSAGGPAGTNCAGEIAGNFKACHQVTGLLAYDAPSFGVASAYDVLYGGPGAAAGLTNSSYSDQRISLNGYVMLGQTKIGLGLVDRKIQAATDTHSDLYYLGVSYPFANYWVLDAQVSRLKIKDTAKVSTLSVARLTYNLSKRTALYTSFGYIQNSGSAAVALDAGGTVGIGLNQVGVMTGVRHTF
ncbi:porin [Glaciimonas immobilis]|uniref:Putative porin n=1 Tax=Glaciimonas immobilis TaxID=728004 RepID=A0A840RQI4_9BURK|nr:porin [Glaciimonas immobilis]KAF3997630.1 porin [Glaciimonas immobilis]MBB5200667.1 putative porin [Glaciimonas immobilis]